MGKKGTKEWCGLHSGETGRAIEQSGRNLGDEYPGRGEDEKGAGKKMRGGETDGKGLREALNVGMELAEGGEAVKGENSTSWK